MYCTTDDIIYELTAKIAAQLTSSAEPDTAVITDKILEAEGYINSYLDGVYELPLKNTHDIIKEITVDYVKFLMKKSRVNIDTLESVIKSVDERLEEIAIGKPVLSGEVRISPFLVVVGSKPKLTTKFWDGYDN